MFTFDGSALKKFSQELGKLPKLIEQAEAMTLNNMAFKFKEAAANSIIENFTSRKPGFVRSSFRVEKATADNMNAVAGSIALSNTNSGFTEMLGETDTRGRVPTFWARGGNAANMIPKKNRLTPGTDFPDASSEGDIRQFLATQYRTGAAQSGGAFMVRGNNAAFTPGLYRFEKPRTGKTAKEKYPIKMVQRFSAPKTAPKKLNWIEIALSKITEDFVNEAHTKNLDYLAKKLLKKVFR